MAYINTGTGITLGLVHISSSRVSNRQTDTVKVKNLTFYQLFCAGRSIDEFRCSLMTLNQRFYSVQ
jgi:hypothetical protein